MDNIIITNTKYTISSISTYMNNISIDIIILMLIIYYIYNNLDRFSTSKIFNLKLEKRHIILIYAIIIGILSILIIYCKTFTILNNNSVGYISKLSPILFILIPYFTIILIIFMDSNEKIKRDVLKNTEDLPLSYPPKFILPKSLNIIIGLIILLLIISNISIFSDFFNNIERKTILDSILTSHPHRKPSSKLIYFIFGLIIVSHIYILVNNIKFTPCNSNLPKYW